MMPWAGPGMQTLGVPAESRDPLVRLHATILAGLWPLSSTGGLRHPTLRSQRRYVPQYCSIREHGAVALATGLPPDRRAKQQWLRCRGPCRCWNTYIGALLGAGLLT
jgi:hypothetical protein